MKTLKITSKIFALAFVVLLMACNSKPKTEKAVEKSADENWIQLFNGDKPNVLANSPISRISVGESLWHFYGYETDGIFQNQGEIDAAATQGNAAPGDIRFKASRSNGSK